MSGYIESQLIILCMSVIYAYAIFLPAASGQLNLGAAGFITLGAYTSGWLNLSDGAGLPMAVSIVLSMVFVGAIGFAISLPILRTRGVYMVLATFAFAVILFCFYFMSTRLGLALRSIHDDENVAVPFGVDVRTARVVAFTVGGMLAGLGGAIYGRHYNYVEAQTFNVLLSIYILLYVPLGGTQTAWGPLVGAIFFTVIPELFRQFAVELGSNWLADSRFVFFGIFIVLMMVVRPEGVVTRTMQDRCAGLLAGRDRSIRTGGQSRWRETYSPSPACIRASAGSRSSTMSRSMSRAAAVPP